jgi:hypothetical protein
MGMYLCALPGLHLLKGLGIRLQHPTMTSKPTVRCGTDIYWRRTGLRHCPLFEKPRLLVAVTFYPYIPLLITRYLQGPYDELLWIPRAFNHPKTGKQTYLATRAYVFSKESIYHGWCPSR